MHYLLGRQTVENVAAWKALMAAHRETHRAAGLHFHRVWSNTDNPHEILFLFRVDDLARARSFLEATGALDREKQQRGEAPSFLFLEPR